MRAIRTTTLFAIGLFAGAAVAQPPAQPLNLQLPPGMAPATASTAATNPATPPTHDANGNPISAPGVYYGDTSGRTGNAGAHDIARQCDDSTYNQPQVHGSASMGVMGGSHVSGNYQTGTLDVTKNLGDCEHPTGGVHFSISVGQSQVHGHGR